MVQLFSLVGTLLMIFLCAVFPLLGVPLVAYFALIGLGLIGD